MQPCFELESLGEVELRGIERPLRAARVTGRARAGRRCAPSCRSSAARPSSRCSTTPARRSPTAAARSSRSRGESGIGKSRLVHRGAPALRRPHPLPRGPRRLVCRELPVLARARPAARLARHRRRRSRGARAARAEGRARRRSGTTRIGLPVPRPPARAAARGARRPRRCASSAARPCSSRPFAAVRARRASRSPRRSRSASSSTTCSGPTRSRSSSSRTCSTLTEEVQLGILLIYRAERDQPSWRLGERARAALPAPLPRDRAAAAARRTRAASWPRRLAESALPGVARRPARRARRRQPVLPRGGAAGSDRARRAAPPRRRAGSSRDGAGRRADARAGRAAGAARPAPPRTREVVSVAARDRPRLRAAAARAPAAARAGGAGAVGADAARPRSSRSAGGRRPSTASATASCRRSPTAACSSPRGASLHRPHRRGARVARTATPSEAVYGPLARHFAEADEPERAARYLLAAGDAARAVYADHEAIEHYRRARSVPAPARRPRARARDAVQDRARAPPGVRLRARRGRPTTRPSTARREERSERAPAPAERSTLALVAARLLRARRHATRASPAIVIEQLFRGLLRVDHDLNVVPELAAEHERLGRRPDRTCSCCARTRCWSDGAPAHRRRLRLRLAQAARGGPRHGVPARRHRLGRGARRLDARGAPARAAQLLPVRARVALGLSRGRAPRRRGSVRPGASRSHSSATGRSCLVEVDAERRAPAREPALARPRGNVGEVRIAFRDRRRAAARRADRGPLRPPARSRRGPRRRPRHDRGDARRRSRRRSSASTRNGRRSTDERVRRALAHATRPRRAPATRPASTARPAAAAPSRRSCPATATDAGPRTTPSAPRALLAEAGYPGRRGPRRDPVPHDARRVAGETLVEQLAAVGVRARSSSGRSSTSASHWRRHAVVSSAGTPTIPIRTASTSACSSWTLPLYRDDETDAVLAQARVVARPRRAAAALARVRARLDRQPRRARAARLRAPPVPAPSAGARLRARPALGAAARRDRGRRARRELRGRGGRHGCSGIGHIHHLGNRRHGAAERLLERPRHGQHVRVGAAAAEDLHGERQAVGVATAGDAQRRQAQRVREGAERQLAAGPKRLAVGRDEALGRDRSRDGDDGRERDRVVAPASGRRPPRARRGAARTRRRRRGRA